MSKRSQLIWRMGASLLFGLLLGSTCLNLGLNETRRLLQRPQDDSRSSLRLLEKMLNEYRQQHRIYPGQLARFPTWKNSPVFDGWGRPFIYTLQDQGYSLTTYGKDGKAGGNGLNCDLSTFNPKPPQARISTQEVLTYPSSGNVIKGAIVCGLLTALLVFGSLEPAHLARHRIGSLLTKVTLTLVAAGAISFFITLADVPSGH